MNEDKELKELEEIMQMIETRESVQEKIELYKSLEQGYSNSISVLIHELPLHINDPIKMQIILQRISMHSLTGCRINQRIKALEEE